MKQVIFRAPHRWGSSINRGEEISEHLQSQGYQSKYWDSPSLTTQTGTNTLPSDIKDSIVVYLKFPVDKEYEQVKQNNNKILIDVIDCIGNNDYSLEQICNLSYFPLDGLIVPTEDLKNKVKILKPELEVEVLYHHWDKKHLQNVDKYKNDRNEFRLAYIGSPGGHFHEEKIDNLTAVYEWEKMTSTSPYYTCHYSVRPKNDSQFLYKPNTKISVAAAVGANAVHSRDNALKKLLPYDYPYFTDSDLESVQKTAKYAEETFGSPIWNEGLEMMKDLKNRTSIERIAGVDYVEFFERF